MCDYFYLDVNLELNHEDDRDIEEVFFKKHILKSLEAVFGEVGASITVDILKYNSETKRTILRVPTESFVKLYSSLTLSGKYEGIECAFRVHKVSPCLLSLLSNSRTFVH